MPDDERSSDGQDRHPPPLLGRAAGRVSARRLAIAAVVCAYAAWVVVLPSFSSTATIAVVLAGGAAAFVGARGRRSAPRPTVATVAPWAALTAVAAAWQLAAYLQQPRDDHPTLSSLANDALGSHAARTAAFVAWLLATVEIARR